MRTKFYAATPGPDGQRSAAIAERQRQMIEDAALPILARLEESWPLADEERIRVAQWIAVMHLGSPASADRFPEHASRFWADIEANHPGIARAAAAERHELAEPDFWLFSMFAQVPLFATSIGMMHWSLIRFRKPLLVSGDHPIVDVPLLPGRDSGGANDLQFLDSVEVRLPVSPTAAVLLTWTDRDDRAPATWGRRQHARAINHATWARARQHIFWSPAIDPTHPSQNDRYQPLGEQLIAGYSTGMAFDSERRNIATDWLRYIDNIGIELADSLTTLHIDTDDGRARFRLQGHTNTASTTSGNPTAKAVKRRRAAPSVAAAPIVASASLSAINLAMMRRGEAISPLVVPSEGGPPVAALTAVAVASLMARVPAGAS